MDNQLLEFHSIVPRHSQLSLAVIIFSEPIDLVCASLTLVTSPYVQWPVIIHHQSPGVKGAGGSNTDTDC